MPQFWLEPRLLLTQHHTKSCLRQAREFHSGSMLPSSPNRSNPVLSAAGVAVSDVQGAAGGAPGAGGEPAGFSQADPQFQASPYGFPHHAVLAPALHGSQGAPRPFAGTPMHAQQHQVPPGYPTSSYVGWPAGAPPGGPLGDTLQGLAAYAPPVQRWVQAAGPPYQPHAVQYAVASSDSGAPASPSSQASSKTLDSMAAQMRAMQVIFTLKRVIPVLFSISVSATLRMGPCPCTCSFRVFSD